MVSTATAAAMNRNELDVALSQTATAPINVTAIRVPQIALNQGAAASGSAAKKCAIAAIREAGTDANQKSAPGKIGKKLRHTAAIDSRVIGATKGSQSRLEIIEYVGNDGCNCKRIGRHIN